ncbi:hypothetical protein J7M28_07975 [bacterium]|nr:hypothetical protein [bacterium]
MANEIKKCTSCGNKLNQSPADKIYSCPYCGLEFVEKKGKLVKREPDFAVNDPLDEALDEAQMKQDMADALEDMPLGQQLADEAEKLKRKKDEKGLLELRMKRNEARTLIRTAYRTGISLSVFLDAVMIILTYNYDVILYGLIGAFVLTVGTMLYLSSYAAGIRKWSANIEAQAQSTEEELYHTKKIEEAMK